MKYLLCELDDENYAYPKFSIYDSFDKAFKKAVDVCNEIFKHEFDYDIHIEDRRNRVTGDYGDEFYVTEIKEFDETAGDHLLVWHHGYDGVDFKILFQGTYDGCFEKQKSEIKRIFEEYDLSDADNEDFDIETGCCIDTGTEWEMFTIINIEEMEMK